MVSSMARDAYDQFVEALPKLAASSYGEAYFAWLVEESGLECVGENYSIAVETLILILTRRPAEFVLGKPDEPGVWEFMTETGFTFEVFVSGRAGRKRRVTSERSVDARGGD